MTGVGIKVKTVRTAGLAGLGRRFDIDGSEGGRSHFGLVIHPRLAPFAPPMAHTLARILTFASAVSAAAGATSWCPSSPAGSGDLTAEEVERWAADSSLFVRFAAVLREHEIDQFALRASSEESLVTIGIPLGVAVKLKFCADELRDDQEAAASASAQQLITGTAQRAQQLDAPKYGATQKVRLLGEVVVQEPHCSIGSVFSHLMSINQLGARACLRKSPLCVLSRLIGVRVHLYESIGPVGKRRRVQWPLLPLEGPSRGGVVSVPPPSTPLSVLPLAVRLNSVDSVEIDARKGGKIQANLETDCPTALVMHRTRIDDACMVRWSVRSMRHVQCPELPPAAPDAYWWGRSAPGLTCRQQRPLLRLRVAAQDASTGRPRGRRSINVH
jgi:hypothetical protein